MKTGLEALLIYYLGRLQGHDTDVQLESRVRAEMAKQKPEEASAQFGPCVSDARFVSKLADRFR
jgi:hypothetical protein